MTLTSETTLVKRISCKRDSGSDSRPTGTREHNLATAPVFEEEIELVKSHPCLITPPRQLSIRPGVTTRRASPRRNHLNTVNTSTQTPGNSRYSNCPRHRQCQRVPSPFQNLSGNLFLRGGLLALPNQQIVMDPLDLATRHSQGVAWMGCTALRAGVR
jgi:hypothetical protein